MALYLDMTSLWGQDLQVDQNKPVLCAHITLLIKVKLPKFAKIGYNFIINEQILFYSYVVITPFWTSRYRPN